MKLSRAAVLLLAALLSPGVSSRPALAQQGSVREDLRIGSIDGMHDAFGEIDDIAVGPDGEIYVTQSRAHVVKVFSPTGEFIRDIGGRGSGPGELLSATDLLWSGGLQVMDQRRMQLSLFSADGEFVRLWRAPRYDFDGPYQALPPAAVLDNGAMIVEPTYRVFRQDRLYSIPIVLLNQEERLIGVVDSLHLGDAVRTAHTSSGVRAVIQQPVSSKTLWAVEPGGAHIITVRRSVPTSEDTHRFSVTKLLPSLDTVFNRSYAFEPVRIPDEAIERAREELIKRELERDVPFGRSVFEEIYSDRGWRVPPFQAPIDRLVVGRDGTIWLRRGAFGRDTVPWLVLGPDGAMVGRVRLSTDLEIMAASRDHLWAVEEGRFDEPYVVRLEAEIPAGMRHSKPMRR